MADQQGIITFIHHNKQYATIDYEHNGKMKSITARVNDGDKAKTKSKHVFRIGDAVKFEMQPSARGDKMIAGGLKFLYNTALEILVNKARIENRFAGFLKEADGDLYIKERDSYIFFPLKVLKWENPPASSAFNEVITFKLVNIDKPHALVAELFSHDFTPAYRQAVEFSKNGKTLEAVVTKTSPFAVYLGLFGGELTSKLPADKLTGVNAGDKIPVRIIHLSGDRVVVEPA
jgi:hypothetical protein